MQTIDKHLYIPFAVAKQSDEFRNWLQDETKKKYSSDSKAALASLEHYGFSVEGIEFDLLLAAYIVNPQKSYPDVASIAREFGYMDVHKMKRYMEKVLKKRLPADEIVAEHASQKSISDMEIAPNN